MKRTGIGIWLLAAVVLISGCGKRADNGKGINSGETVDKVIESQVKKEEQKKTEESTKEDTQKNNQQNTDTQTPESVQGTVNAPEAAVDVDLSVMDSDMIYATVYQMMSDPETMAYAADALSSRRNCMIDINMGCPVPKIVKGGDGSALLKDPEKVSKIVSATVRAAKKPVTVKIRAGWNEKNINHVW